MLQQCILRAPDMEYDGQAIALSQVKLGPVKGLLLFAHIRRFEPWKKKIQSNLAYGDKAGVIERCNNAGLQRVKIGILSIGHAYGVSAQRIGDTTKGMRQDTPGIDIGERNGG